MEEWDNVTIRPPIAIGATMEKWNVGTPIAIGGNVEALAEIPLWRENVEVFSRNPALVGM